MRREFQQLFNCPECITELTKGDIVQCLIDPLYLTESHLDFGRSAAEIGIVIGINFFRERQQALLKHKVLCEVAVYWSISDVTSFHLERYIQKIV